MESRLLKQARPTWNEGFWIQQAWKLFALERSVEAGKFCEKTPDIENAGEREIRRKPPLFSENNFYLAIKPMKTVVKTSLALLLGLLPLTAAAQWISAANMPAPRYGAASAVYNGKLYVFGGVDRDQNVCTETFAYDTQQGRWEMNHAPLPVPRRQAAAVTFHGKIYVIGGSDGSTTSDSVFVYKPDEETWELAGQLVRPREGCVAVVWRDNIYVLAGASVSAAQTDYLNDVEIFDTVVGRGVPVSITLPDPPRANLAAASFMGNLYVMGGMYFGPVDLVDMLGEDGQWHRLPGLRTPRAFAATITTPEGLYVLGGEGFSGPLRSVERLPATAPEGPFYYADSLNTARAEAAAGYVEGLLVVAGGRGTTDPLASVEQFFPPSTDVRSRGRTAGPRDFELHGPYPNPFSRETRVSVKLHSGSSVQVEIAVFDCLGRLIRRLNVHHSRKNAWAIWDGRDDREQPVTAGVYLIRVQLASRTHTRKIVHVR